MVILNHLNQHNHMQLSSLRFRSHLLESPVLEEPSEESAPAPGSSSSLPNEVQLI